MSVTAGILAGGSGLSEMQRVRGHGQNWGQENKYNTQCLHFLFNYSFTCFIQLRVELNLRAILENHAHIFTQSS